MTDNGASMKTAGTAMAADPEHVTDYFGIMMSIPTETRNKKPLFHHKCGWSVHVEHLDRSSWTFAQTQPNFFVKMYEFLKIGGIFNRYPVS